MEKWLTHTEREFAFVKMETQYGETKAYNHFCQPLVFFIARKPIYSL